MPQGLIMVYNVTEDEAFWVLVKASSHLNEKLSHLAERIAHALAEPHTDPDRSPLTLLEKYLRP